MIGQTILHYKIIEELGRGGMGAVFKAQDTKLDRFVALKFLPSQFTSTEEEKARFIQEAKAASAMNHPNVCTIHDIQEYTSEGGEKQLFIVMEFIDGKTLRDKKNISEKQILEIGVQVAEGLAAAHEKGIVHRDIKPENIMIRKEGIVQIMDFGLAKLFAPTGASRLTRMGTTMGTMGYMSPEQVQGADVDHRTDIFSLGVVLYEMLAGEPPFKGMHETAIMYEIVNVDAAPISTVKEGIDPQLDAIILECLEKDKDDRCQSAKELAKDLKKIKKSSTNRTSRIYNVNSQAFNVKSGQSQDFSAPRAKTIGDMPVRNLFRNIFYNPKVFWVASGVLFILVVLLFSFSLLNGAETEIFEIKSSIIPPHGIVLDNSRGSNLTISPDGKFISFIGVDSSGASKLWIRPINSLSARALTNATIEAYPFWSPDSRSIAYFERGKLMKISLDAGTSLPICDATSGRGGSWSSNGTIIFTPDPTGGLFKVSSSGGKPEQLIKADASNLALSIRWAHFLPDGDHFLYSTENSASGSSAPDAIYVSSLSDNTSKKLLSASSNCQYAGGYLLFVRQSILLAQKFNPAKLKLEGEAMPVAENVQYHDARISASFAASQTGVLIYLDQTLNNEKTVLLDKNGNVIKKLQDQKPRFGASFSPDQNKIAFDIYDPNEKNVDIWIYDLNRNVSTRLTFKKSADIFPGWSPDGRQIAFSSNSDTGVFDTYLKNADGSGDEKLLYKSGSNKIITDISSDGNYYVSSIFAFASTSSARDIVLLPATGDKNPVALVATNYDELLAKFSPNLKWIAYTTDESGKMQVYIIPFNKSGSLSQVSGKWQISIDGGIMPKWMNNGKSIYFFTADNKIMAVDLNENGNSISPGKPYLIFNSENKSITGIYDINKKGTEIIASIPIGRIVESPISLVINWQKEVEGKK